MRVLIEVIDAKGETVTRLGLSIDPKASRAEVAAKIHSRMADTVFSVGDTIRITEVK